MSDRLTPKWTDDLESAFGEAGKVGTKGELIVLDKLTNLGYRCELHPSNKELQISGVDLTFTVNERIFNVDVKANLHSTKTDVCVEWPKLIKSKADFWAHVDIKTEDYLMYRVSKMIHYIKQNNIRKIGSDELCWINQKVAESL